MVLFMFMLSFICVILCDLSQWKLIYAGFFSISFFYALPLEIQLSRGDGSLTGLTPPQFVPISWYFSMFNELM